MDEGTGSEARKSQQHVPESVQALVPRAKGVTEGALLPKNCLVDVRSPVAATVDSVVLLEVVVEYGYVGERLVDKHAVADSFCEFLDLFLDVGEERLGVPPSDEHYGVDGLFSEVH